MLPLRAVGSADGFRGFLPSALRPNLRAPDPGAKYYLSRFGAHDLFRTFSRGLRACAIF